MQRLLLLNKHLNELYGDSPLIPSYRVNDLERAVFNIDSLSMRELIENIDGIFLSDAETPFDKTLKKIDLIATSNSNFTLKFHIE